GVEDKDEDEYDSEGGGSDDEGQGGEGDFNHFKTRIRIEETQRAEKNRRPGGIKTQNAMVKAWEEFVAQALKKGEIKDQIIDEHHLLLYIKFCSERPKRDRRGNDIPGTYIGAAHIKKLYFGALRIRKEQEAHDPSLRKHRPATSVHVWDALRGRMNEALNRVRNGLTPEEDAPDIIANTFLAGITEEQMDAVGRGFLSHRELGPTINGHLAWTAQNASGNRGDDFRALKLCEIQPYSFIHPIHTLVIIFCILALQGEEKAGAHRGMRTKINPVYTGFIPHRQPERCPVGAFALFLHYIHDYKNLTEVMKIDWFVNKSWRQIRVLHGPRSPTTPYHEQSLYNLYVRAFHRANFSSSIKQHLPRHILGFRQEAMGVNPQETAKLGWERGKTYENNYKPPLPKEAILGSHGYKLHETYDPQWRHVPVPDQFLKLFCPQAEEMFLKLNGQPNLQGAANHWKMIISLRPYLFQCGAAIFQICPESSIFRLPALANLDVRNWMKTGYPTSLSLLEAKAGNSFEVERIQNKEIRDSLEGMRSMMEIERRKLEVFSAKIERRTAVLSPTKFSSSTYYNSYPAADLSATLFTPPNLQGTSSTSCPSTPTPVSTDDLGFYTASDNTPRAFVNASPKATSSPRLKTHVDLVLPPVSAFYKPGDPPLLWPPVLGQKSITWDKVFALIHPESTGILWNSWKPSKSLDQYTLEELWACYNSGEQVFDESGTPTGIKPPLRLVDEHFHSSWRKSAAPTDRKKWERFREIPEWIQSESACRKVSPQIILDELDGLMKNNPKITGMNSLAKEVKSMRFEKAKARKEEEAPEADNVVAPKRKARAIDPRKGKKSKI
ncbi:hypothetical protein BDN70DRAFT_814884, partial [Pholiota conissans]